MATHSVEENNRMTDMEWKHSTNPEEMIKLLCGKGSRRKLRLFAIACCRRVLPLFVSNGGTVQEALHSTLEMSEQDADGLLNPKLDARYYSHCLSEFESARKETARAGGKAATKAIRSFLTWEFNPSWEASTKFEVGTANDITHVCAIVRAVVEALKCDAIGDKNAARLGERLRHADQLRCVFGNPFRSIRITPDWLTWNRGRVRGMAQVIDEERRFGDLPILGDALEESGCDDSDILDHCRRPGKHIRGCFVIDSLLSHN
jgi:hypothetical protein